MDRDVGKTAQIAGRQIEIDVFQFAALFYFRQPVEIGTLLVGHLQNPHAGGGGTAGQCKIERFAGQKAVKAADAEFGGNMQHCEARVRRRFHCKGAIGTAADELKTVAQQQVRQRQVAGIENTVGIDILEYPAGNGSGRPGAAEQQATAQQQLPFLHHGPLSLFCRYDGVEVCSVGNRRRLSGADNRLIMPTAWSI